MRGEGGGEGEGGGGQNRKGMAWKDRGGRKGEGGLGWQAQAARGNRRPQGSKSVTWILPRTTSGNPITSGMMVSRSLRIWDGG